MSISPYWNKLEQAGRVRFDSLEAATYRRCKRTGIEKSLVHPVPECVEKLCYDLQIRSGAIVGKGGSPQIFINHPVRGGAVDPSVAIESGEREAWKDDNRKKLGAAKTDERHLVVYVDSGLPWIALIDFEPPSAAPKIPQEISHIWLIGHSGEASKNEFVVWRAGRGQPWHSQRVVVHQNECKAS